MAVCHMVWFQFKSDAADADIDAVLDDAKSLLGQIPGLESISAGRNFTDRAPGYGGGLMAILKDKDALPVYAKHPVHVAYAGRIREVAEYVMAMDYEF